MKTKLGDVLDFFLWGLETFSRRDCGLILAGLRQCESDRQAHQLLTRLERQQLVKREGRGQTARFVITEAGAKRSAPLDVVRHWDAPWDGKWRVFTYDLPEKRRTERVLLWRALCAQKLGLVQRSIWVWPHDVEPLLQGTLHATGIPECFCGWVCDGLFLCTHSELVAVAWDFDKISEGHKEFLRAAPRHVASLKAAHGFQEVARAAAAEREAYHQAFALDPLLPRGLFPKSYSGPAVQQHHAKFRELLESRVQDLAGK